MVDKQLVSKLYSVGNATLSPEKTRSLLNTSEEDTDIERH
jgi:hypothetical protein